MKCAIFCLLAFCVFETVVSAVTKQYFIQLHDASVKKINDMASPVTAAVQAAADAAKKKGKDTGDCVESSSVSLKTYVDPRISELDDCRDAAFKTLNQQVAQKCCNDVIEGFKSEVKQALKSGVGCVKNCMHTDCSENE